MSERTVLVAKEAAQNLAANRVSISIEQAANEKSPPSTTFQAFFAKHPTNRIMNNVQPTGPTFSTNSRAEESTKKLSNPALLRRELDGRMKEMEKNAYPWVLQKKKYPVAIGLMVDYIMSKVEHRKPSDTSCKLPVTVATQDAIRNYRRFSRRGRSLLNSKWT